MKYNSSPYCIFSFVFLFSIQLTAQLFDSTFGANGKVTITEGYVADYGIYFDKENNIYVSTITLNKQRFRNKYYKKVYVTKYSKSGQLIKDFGQKEKVEQRLKECSFHTKREIEYLDNVFVIKHDYESPEFHIYDYFGENLYSYKYDVKKKGIINYEFVDADAEHLYLRSRSGKDVFKLNSNQELVKIFEVNSGNELPDFKIQDQIVIDNRIFFLAEFDKRKSAIICYDKNGKICQNFKNLLRESLVDSTTFYLLKNDYLYKLSWKKDYNQTKEYIYDKIILSDSLDIMVGSSYLTNDIYGNFIEFSDGRILYNKQEKKLHDMGTGMSSVEIVKNTLILFDSLGMVKKEIDLTNEGMNLGFHFHINNADGVYVVYYNRQKDITVMQRINRFLFN